MDLSTHEAAKALGISEVNLNLAENGERPLTLSQLRKASEIYQVPFGYFYLKEIPEFDKPKPVPDLRLEPGNVGVEHYRLNLEIKKCRDRREVFLDLASELEQTIVAFKTVSGNNYAELALSIRKRLNVTDEDVSRLSFDKTYAFWKERIESDGVLVYESQHIPDITGVIGAALFYSKYPIILIKRGAEFNERKLFTLLHEYAHLLYGQSAINDLTSQTGSYLSNIQNDLETKCNALASEILIPSKLVDISSFAGLSSGEMMIQIAETFKVTYSTAAVCLKRLGLINSASLSELLEMRRVANVAKKPKKGTEIKIPRENIVRQDIGKPMFRLVLNAYAAGLLDIFDTSSILNLRVKKIDKLMSELR